MRCHRRETSWIILCVWWKKRHVNRHGTQIDSDWRHLSAYNYCLVGLSIASFTRPTNTIVKNSGQTFFYFSFRLLNFELSGFRLIDSIEAWFWTQIIRCKIIKWILKQNHRNQHKISALSHFPLRSIHSCCKCLIFDFFV